MSSLTYLTNIGILVIVDMYLANSTTAGLHQITYYPATVFFCYHLTDVRPLNYHPDVSELISDF